MARRRIDFSNPYVASEIITKLVANSPVAYVILDSKMRVHFMNDNYVKLRKIDKSSMLGNYCYNLINRGVPCKQCAVRTVFETGQRQFLTRKDTLYDGSVRYIDEYAMPLADDNGNFSYVLEVTVDRTRELSLRESSNKVFMGLVETLIAILEKKDLYTSSHSQDVTSISLKLGRYIGLDNQQLRNLRLAALLHDIGKIHVPDDIINKPSQLTDDEFLRIKTHAHETLNMLDHLSRFAEIRRWAGHHHERWDGKGYPDRLKREDIPLGARIIALADTYDAMTSTRSYRQAMPHRTALEEIHRQRGRQFDPELTDKFLIMADSMYFSRDSLIAAGDEPANRQNVTTVRVERKLEPADKNATCIVDNDMMRYIFSEDVFAKKILDNSLCYYTIIDNEFNVLFNSENVAQALGIPSEKVRTLSCFDVCKVSDGCVAPGEDREADCPVVRAFRSGKEQRGPMLKAINNRPTHCDSYVVPLDLEDVNGEKFPCVMEILIDRTQERLEHMAMDGDIKTLLDMLVRFFSELDSETTKSSEEIIRQCTSFTAYLTRMEGKSVRSGA